jgi:galactokinase
MSPIDSVRSEFLNRYLTEPRLFRAPGRINLIGEHTDYNDGFVMPAAINREIVFALGHSTDSQTIIYSLDEAEEFVVPEGDLHPVKEPHWANYLLGVLARLKDLGYKVGPVRCVFGGDIPIGAGLSSSAALECGFIYGLASLFNLGIEKVEMVKAAQWAEHNYAGVKCGIMDQFASMMSEPEQVLFLDCRSLAYKYFPLVLPGYAVVLLDTRVKHSLASSEYNIRRGECEEGVRLLKRYLPEAVSLRDISSAQVLAHRDDLPGVVYERCLYVTQEIERVQAAGEDLLRGDIRAFGKKMFATHDGLSRLYQVSCEELDFLVELARANNSVLGSRMMGGGFGGCTINIMASDQVDGFVEHAANAYGKKFNSQLKAYITEVVKGVSAI